MSSLRSLVDELAGEELAEVDDRRLEADLVELNLQVTRLQAQASRRLVEIDRRGTFEADGYLSTTSWLRHQSGLSAREAAVQVHRARALADMPDARAAYEAGDLSTRVVDLLVAARKRHPEIFAEHEAALVREAAGLRPRDAARLIAYWRQSLDHLHVDDMVRHNRRRLSIAATFDGMVHGEFELDAEGGEAVLAAIRALAETTDPSDSRSPTQRRADALVDLCRDYLDHGEAPVKGGERPHMNVIVSLQALEQRSGYPLELGEAGVISGDAARRIACDCGISRIITAGDSEPLDVGRRTRTIPPAIRRALVVRDGGCVIAGCDRPARWCDAHHRVHWIDGGPTSLDNLELLCRRHHRMVHDGRELERRPRAP
ncbi:MAG: DUF222 domain-containing protein [Acidimicrobiia bacterium]|nr:HNH endonuclease [Acidimicrobiia bacterium]MBT8217829.1 HNH endonuclease [Acidimicrobiia bacterium]NNF10375.1 DUF222 domain-containing protein [Acidimicrobiia bacterium]NNL68423.1 DUF222 domain-containing protein [Acidimicrobiia bacterium]